MEIGRFSGLLNKTINLKIRNVSVSPSYLQAAAIVFLLFLLVFTVARMRYLYVHWSLSKSSLAMLFWGFVLTLIIEGFLIVSGRTLLTEILGWRKAPKPVSTALDISRAKLIDVLGVTGEIPQSVANEIPTFQNVVSDFVNLSSEDKETVRKFVCEP
jgi:hypothetical protein